MPIFAWLSPAVEALTSDVSVDVTAPTPDVAAEGEALTLHVDANMEGVTSLTAAAAAGDTVLHVASNDGFYPGTEALVGAVDGPSETVVVGGLGSLHLVAPLVNSYSVGVPVKATIASADTQTETPSPDQMQPTKPIRARPTSPVIPSIPSYVESSARTLSSQIPACLLEIMSHPEIDEELLQIRSIFGPRQHPWRKVRLACTSCCWCTTQLN